MPEKHLKFHSDNGKRKVLVVEDETLNSNILQMTLQDDYDLLFADCGAQALELIKAHHETLSLVLLDLNLPDVHGTEILRKLKNDVHTALIPIIVMTADQNAEVECLNMGAIDFIPKPYPPKNVILARMRRTIELAEDRDVILWTERDSLTGLYNREYFYHYATQFDTFHKDTPTDAILVDINQFHMINERYGKEFGDEILRQIAQKLLAAVQEDEGIVCRRDADTFLIYCPHRSDYRAIFDSASVEIGKNNRVRLRMGVYAEVDKTIAIENRFDRAKLAADSVKGSMTIPLEVYSDSMHESEVLAEHLLEGFGTAISEKQFVVYYQPKFDIQSKEPLLNSAEALIRWDHPELGLISPGIFIPLFEKNGLIRKLDAFVWKEAAAQIKDWKERLGRVIPISINVSRIDLYDPELLEELENLVAEYGLDHNELFLEITESAYTEDSEQITAVVSELQSKGFHIEMDDFGTGYSSLNMLSTLPIDALKLDMQFVRNAFQRRKDTRLLEAVIGLAKAFDFPTIAEGVETAEQMFTLKSMGCDYAQGYYFSRPLPVKEFEQYIENLDSTKVAVKTYKPTETSKKGPEDQYTYDALHDPLTGLYNHSAFDILFHDSDHDHLAVMVAHVDDYEQIRLERGKNYADKIIQRVAKVLRGTFRSVDNICRLQEAEFVIIMSRMTSYMEAQVFEKIEQVNSLLGEAQDDMQPISLSVGIAFSDREEPEGDVFRDADTALRRMEQMKQRGCIVY